MLRRRELWLGIALAAALVIGGFLYYSNTTNAAAQAESDAAVETAQVRVGSITVSATGAGTVIPAQEVALAFPAGGVLAELLVQVGDQVAAGDVLARLDDSDARQALAVAELQLAQSAMQTDPEATASGVSFDEISIEQAQITLEQAQAELDELLNWTPDEEEIALLEAKLAAAEASYNAARGQEAANGTNITIQGISVEQAKRDLADAEAAYNTAYDPGRDWELNDPRTADALENERDRAGDNLVRAQEALQVAELNYNATVSSTGRSSSTSAASSLLAAQQELAAARSGPTDDEIAAAQTAVRSAELALKQAQLNEESNALSRQQAELNVQAAQADLEATELKAPFAGVVTAVNAGVGETVSGSLIVLSDLSRPMIEIYLDESDLNMVGPGYEVEVTFDALPDQVFTGTVTRVDPQLTSSNGVSVVRAVVQLDTDSFAKPQTLPAGLNATVEVIGGRAENALLVPVEALREISDGQYAVFVMVNGEPELRLVEVGLMDYTYAEILSGLEAGDTVTTGVIATTPAGDTGSTTNETAPSDFIAPGDLGAPPVDGGFVVPLGDS